LRWGALALAAIPVAGAVVVVVRDRPPIRQLRWLTVRVLRAVRGGPWALRKAQGLVRRVEAVHMSGWRWAEVLGFALLNWLYDCAVLITCLLALHVAVPWRGIFVVYGLTQIAAALPITPGGIGVVEGTLGALLHAYGVPVEQAVATVIVYRIVSFWGLVPIGWVTWVALDLLQKKGRRVGIAHPWAEHRHLPEEPPVPALRARRLLPEPQICREAACADGDAVVPARQRSAS
jgi:uncharacterized membrane protein YbhN (UPF0104 family)